MKGPEGESPHSLLKAASLHRRGGSATQAAGESTGNRHLRLPPINFLFFLILSLPPCCLSALNRPDRTQVCFALFLLLLLLLLPTKGDRRQVSERGTLRHPGSESFSPRLRQEGFTSDPKHRTTAPTALRIQLALLQLALTECLEESFY